MSYPCRSSSLPASKAGCSSERKSFDLYERYAPPPHWSVYRFSIAAFVLTLACGFLTGSAFTAWSVRTPPAPVIVQDDIPGGMPVVSIEGIRNGRLVGSAAGGVRLSAGGRPVSIGSGGAFAVSDRKVLTNVVTVQVPEGMRYLASSRGKKYYPVDSSSAQNIVSGNRIYFPDEASALRAGYVR